VYWPDAGGNEGARTLRRIGSCSAPSTRAGGRAASPSRGRFVASDGEFVSASAHMAATAGAVEPQVAAPKVDVQGPPRE